MEGMNPPDCYLMAMDGGWEREEERGRDREREETIELKGGGERREGGSIGTERCGRGSEKQGKSVE